MERLSTKSLVKNKSLGRAKLWLNPNSRRNSSASQASSSSTSEPVALIEHYNLRNDPKALTIIILHRLPQSSVTSAQIAQFIRFQNAPRCEGLTGEDVEKVYTFLKTKPQLYYNPWKRLVDPSGKRIINKAEEQHLLAQLEPAKKYQVCVMAYRDLMSYSQRITKKFENAIAAASSMLGTEVDEADIATYNATFAEMERLLEEMKAKGGYESDEDFDAELCHPANRGKI